MNQLAPFRSAAAFPVLVAAAGESAKLRFLEFFTANIRNRNTRRAYAQAVREFLAWREDHRVRSIAAVQPTSPATSRSSLVSDRRRPPKLLRPQRSFVLRNHLLLGTTFPG
jgi:hypothetical protein